MKDECPECEKKKRLQAKLTIGPSDDPLEQEADRVAEQVLGAPAARAVTAAKPHIQRLAAQPGAATDTAPASVDRVLAGSGRPLDGVLRRDMEERFGRDFSQVRVHSGSAAEQSARDVRANAYTVGQNIVFGVGQFAPGTPSGRRLIAHELTHVVQQADPSGTAPENQSAQHVHGPTTLLQRDKATPQTCAGWTCLADLSACDRPDPGKTGNGEPSKSWTLTAMIDVDVPTPEEVGISSFGHSYVKFNESNGTEYSYGFYPKTTADAAFGVARPTPGCVVHPDVTHAPCVDYRETFTLTKVEYDKALSNSKLWCTAAPNYELFDVNCTTFVAKVVESAGKSLPSYRGKVSKAGVTADNPNTLLASLQERDKAKPADPKLLADDIIGMLRFSQARWVFSRLNGMWMKVMLEVLTELNKRKYLDQLFDFFAVAQDVNKPRLMAAMRAVRLKTTTPKPSDEQIAAILALAPDLRDLPEQHRSEVTAYLKS